MVIKDIQDLLIKRTPSIFFFSKVIYNAEGLPIDYRLLDVNLAFETKLGLKKHEVVGTTISRWLFKSTEIRDCWFKAFGELVLQEGEKEFDEALEFNGHWYLLSAFIPCPGYLIVLLRNATGLKKSEMALREKIAATESGLTLAQNLFDNSPNAIVVYDVIGNGASSRDYIIRDVNPSSLKIEGWRREDVLGKPLMEVRPGAEEFGIFNVFRQIWKTGDTVYYPAKIYREGEKHRWYENTVFGLPAGQVVAVYKDVTEKIRAEEELLAEREKLRVTLYSIGDGVIATDKQGRIEIINQVAENLTGWKQDEARGRPLANVFDVYNGVTGKPCENPVEIVLKSGNIVELANHTILKARDGKERVIMDSAAPIKNQSGEIMGIVLVFRDVTEAKEKEDRIKFLSYHDSLTRLHSRAFLEEELKRLDTENHLPLTLIIGDLDGLKLINDIFGHQVGDQALIKMAEIFRASCRETDVISRWGGDEFVVLLPKTPENVGQAICGRIKKACCDNKMSSIKLSISLGYACKIDKKEKWNEILKKAEDSMYRSKLLGFKSHRSNVLSSIKNALFEKSCETEEHGERIGRFCREIGENMGLSPFKLDGLELLAMLHDVGKIAIDDHILQKPGTLTEDEWAVMKKHPEAGYRIAQAVPELVNIADYILAHHERWDGKGYPKGLSGEEIPLLSRILAIVDAYDAMTQDRPYRKALSSEYAKEELKRNAGAQFDPQLVDIFLAHLEKGREAI